MCGHRHLVTGLFPLLSEGGGEMRRAPCGMTHSNLVILKELKIKERGDVDFFLFRISYITNKSTYVTLNLFQGLEPHKQGHRLMRYI